MNIIKWNERIAAIEAWLNENDAGAMSKLITMTIQAGNDALNDEERDRFWESIRAICKTLPNSPIKKGRGSQLAPETQAVLDSISDEVSQAASDFFAIGDMSMLLTKHGKSGGGLFTIAEYSVYMSSSIVSSLKRRLKDGIWDGTRDGLSTQNFNMEVEEEE